MTPPGSELGLSRRARAMPLSATIKVSQAAAALRASGVPLLDFSVGEPDQDTPTHVVAAGARALAEGRTRYAPPAGIPELRAAVAARYREDVGLDFAAEEVAISCGGKQALFNVCQMLLDPGDEVIVPTPHWPTFPEAVRLAGGRPVFVTCRERDGFELRVASIRRALGPRTRALIVNSPNNPTGAVVDADQWLALGRLAQKRGFTLIYDDTYAKLSYGRTSTEVFAALRRTIPGRFVVVGTASKTYCMTGWRIGWTLGPRALAEACAALASHSTQSPATFAQYGALAALTGPQHGVAERAAEYRRRRDLIYRAVVAIRGVSCVEPAGAFYVFPNVKRFLSSRVPTSLALASRLLADQQIASVPGEGFGAPGYLRISFARPLAELEVGAGRIRRFLEGL